MPWPSRQRCVPAWGSVTAPCRSVGTASAPNGRRTVLNADIHRRFEHRQIKAIADYLLDGYATTVTEYALANLLSPVRMESGSFPLPGCERKVAGWSCRHRTVSEEYER